MKRHLSMPIVASALAAILLTPVAFAQAPAGRGPAANTPNASLPGKAVYDRACAMCHANPGTTRAATFSQISTTSAAQLRTVLTEGVMKAQGSALSTADMTSLIGYLTSGQQAVAANWTDQMMCAADNRTVDVTKPVAFSGFGVDLHSTRNLTARQSGLKKSDMAKLEVAWAIGFPQSNTLGTGVAVLGDTAFVNAAGRLLALDTAKGCARWVKTVSSRNTPQIADLEGRKVLVFSVGGNVSVFDARTGDQVWSALARATDNAGSVRGGVVVYKDKIIVPISASGVSAGQQAGFECCTGHGAVVALSLKDGRKLWEYHTMPTATYTGQVSKTGVKQRGPSGAPIWALPTIDEKRNRVIVATGEDTSHPGTTKSDAIIALDLDTGREIWS